METTSHGGTVVSACACGFDSQAWDLCAWSLHVLPVTASVLQLPPPVQEHACKVNWEL